MSKKSVRGGDVTGLLERFAQLQKKAPACPIGLVPGSRSVRGRARTAPLGDLRIGMASAPFERSWTCLARNGDHRRRRFVFVSAAIIADAIDGSTGAIRIRAPLANSISTTLLADGGGNARGGVENDSDGAGAIVTAACDGAAAAGVGHSRTGQGRGRGGAEAAARHRLTLARCANSLRSSTIDMVSLRYRPPFQTLIAAGVLIQIVAPSHPRLDNSSAGNRAKRRLKNTRHLLSLVGHKPFLLNLNRRDAARFLPHCRPTASLRWPNVLFRDCPRCRLSAEYGDVYFGHFPKIPKRLIGPPLSTRASLHAWSWSEVA